MKKLIFVLGLLIIPFSGFSDTLDYWHVSYNGKVIKKFNQNSQKIDYTLQLNKIKAEDKITIQYGDDTPCDDCLYFLLVRDDRRKKLKEVAAKKNWSGLTITLGEPIEHIKNTRNKTLNFYYSEQGSDNKRSPEKLVFQLKLI